MAPGELGRSCGGDEPPATQHPGEAPWAGVEPGVHVCSEDTAVIQTQGALENLRPRCDLGSVRSRHSCGGLFWPSCVYRTTIAGALDHLRSPGE
jgi:hypothetical protein